MSRSGYSDGCGEWDLIRWRGAVESALRGKRGQQFLRDLVVALDAIPDQRLIVGTLEKDGAVCALGSVCKLRGLPMDTLNQTDEDGDFCGSAVAQVLGIAPAMAKEIMFENDDDFGIGRETPEHRWARMRAWAVAQIKKATP